MLFATIAQPQLFLWMALGGMAAALWYALVDGARRRMQAGTALSLLTDSVFAIGCAAILSAFLVWGNHGALEVYALAGAACGAFICHFALIRPLKALLGRARRAAGAFVKRLTQKRPFNIIFK